MNRTHEAQWILDILTDRGQKITTPRQAMAQIIATRTGVFSPNEIIEDATGMDRVTVYRILDLFELLDIIHPVLTHHGEKHYEVHGTAHHHHIVCTGCEKTSCIDCTEKRKKAKGFTQLHHSVVFTGLCEHCSRI
ncbi:MAG: hypothetical protein COU32_03450 [Candidatus Magasanikbacteria bacterium CG10_big_fil_rev_8_21_14_0_10_42_10]|uniref:Transcriptional repressor n=2 Tax=Candidatus Magasanikiibacteriota TaxID=1752731 RepID=A0A2H0TVL5_9BACT|nr:MAG: hypothetical protein COU32_03450 [Candidatus Magasanikbacteria bacterium CG10_big_fil_rev_8_21_14_0_10_42_10]PIZ93801.1 MAG: hypothetical protein COX82_01975 [Candidatus Magasanikbacteria bacterium CG_4_10_14_0_2_um_filter_41_10]